MTLEDFYNMLKDENPGIKMKTIMLIKLQSGMDSSTFANGFNYEGYTQIVKYFRTDDHRSWNLTCVLFQSNLSASKQMYSIQHFWIVTPLHNCRDTSHGRI